MKVKKTKKLISLEEQRKKVNKIINEENHKETPKHRTKETPKIRSNKTKVNEQ